MTPRELYEQSEAYAIQSRRQEESLFRAAWYGEFFARQKYLRSLDHYVDSVESPPTDEEYKDEQLKVQSMAESMTAEDEQTWHQQ